LPLLKSLATGVLHLCNGTVLAKQYEPVGITVRERPQQYRIHDAEDRRVRSYAQGQGQRGDEGDAGISPQHPYAVTQILKEGIHDSDPTHLAVLLPQQSDVAELAARGSGGLGFTHALANISLGEQAQMRLDLVVEFLVSFATSEQSPESSRQRAQIVGHLYSCPSSLNRRPITPAIRSQFSVSRASCLRPLLVIE
jgi:hypothetical protein